MEMPTTFGGPEVFTFLVRTPSEGEKVMAQMEEYGAVLDVLEVEKQSKHGAKLLPRGTNCLLWDRTRYVWIF